MMMYKQISSLQYQRGFTLIEVLIAAIILFSSIALVAELFSASSLSSKKAIKTANYNQYASIVNRMIKADVQQLSKSKESFLQGNISFNGIDFQWQAQRLSFLPPPMRVDDTSPWAPRFGLYDVSVVTQYDSRRRDYSFQVATW